MAEFISGLLGGSAGVLVGHPLDTIKVKIQTQDYKNPKYRGTWDCFQQTVRKDGFKGLYRGMASPLMGVGAINAVIFGVQGAVAKRCDNPDALRSHFLAGVCAGLTQSFICSPVELTKTRLQIQADMPGAAKYKGPLHCFQEIFKTEGIRGIFRGQLITIMREVPAFGTYFVSYEMCARKLSGTSTSCESGPLATLMAGGIAGSASWVASYPIDVIKSRWQADGAFGPARYSGLVDCLRTSVREEGLASLTRGLNSTLIRAFPTNAATFFVVTNVMKHIDNNSKMDETCNKLAEILHVGDMIIKSGEIAKEVTRYHDVAAKKLRENQLANFLPIVLAASKDSINQITEFLDPMMHFQGEGHDVDTYAALTALLYLPVRQALSQKASTSYISRRGVVTQSYNCSKFAMISRKLLGH